MSEHGRVLVLGLALVLLVTWAMVRGGPHKKYSTTAYWSESTAFQAEQVPAAALEPGNPDGPVLMWAAMVTDDPEVIRTLVARGADPNESDTGDFSATPLSAAAGKNPNPEIVDTLIAVGADIHKRVGSEDKSALIIAAELNPNPDVLHALIRHGADLRYRDRTGRNAHDQALRFANAAAVKVLAPRPASADREPVQSRPRG